MTCTEPQPHREHIGWRPVHFGLINRSDGTTMYEPFFCPGRTAPAPPVGYTNTTEGGGDDATDTAGDADMISDGANSHDVGRSVVEPPPILSDAATDKLIAAINERTPECVCGLPATVRVAVEWADGTRFYRYCVDCAADIEEVIQGVEVLK